jgi:VanZ family protein
MLPLRLKPVWAAVGWLGVALALVFSLWPGGVPLPFRIWDKIQHASGYTILTLWFAGLYPRRRLPVIGLACFALGVAIELLQALTPTRSAEVADACANGLGILVALAIARAGAAGWAQKVEHALGLAPPAAA